jgi:isopentenyldiphosphate isomerase
MTAGDELVDVVDDAGRVVGRVTRREMRARRLPHRSTAVFVFNTRGEIFIHLRTPTKDVYPSHWDTAVGGVLAAGESFAEGATREVREELGIDVPLSELFPFRYADKRNVADVMVYKAVHDGPFELQAEEIVRGEFVAPATIRERAWREPFCPDGLAVFAEYEQKRTWSDS